MDTSKWNKVEETKENVSFNDDCAEKKLCTPIGFFGVLEQCKICKKIL
ncbi:hypothetical protein T190115A13A_270034 [Tenacibaculum sp. 190524A02b]|uniref:Uncharacterized protein n=1 Tax=Tenacibaculum vairaonense TaxID=3137860 RepID=A0ABM9PLX1_9FLAO